MFLAIDIWSLLFASLDSCVVSLQVSLSDLAVV